MDENKRLSGEEQRQRMKEEFKRDLRARKEFMEKVRRLKQSQTILNALENMNVEDDTDEWVARLNQETAFMEAKSELAMDSAGAGHVEIETEEEAAPKLSEEELQKLAAAELVRQMKAQMAAEAAGHTLEEPKSEDEEKPSRKMLDDI